MIGFGEAVPMISRGALPSVELMVAPISESGLMIRPIGRDRNDSSPVSTEAKSSAANTPERIRIVEPLLPQSSGAGEGFRSTPPEIKIFSVDLLTLTPSCSRHERVEPQSRAVEKFDISETPDASPAIKATR